MNSLESGVKMICFNNLKSHFVCKVTQFSLDSIYFIVFIIFFISLIIWHTFYMLGVLKKNFNIDNCEFDVHNKYRVSINWYEH